MSWHYFHYPAVSREAMLERWFLKWWWINEHKVDHVQTGRHYQLATECGLMNYCLQEDKIELIPTL